jgi:hypothetical protein
MRAPLKGWLGRYIYPVADWTDIPFILPSSLFTMAGLRLDNTEDCVPYVQQCQHVGL